MSRKEQFELSVVYLPIGALSPRRSNARTHSTKQVRQIAESIKTFGFSNPVLIDHANSIIAGHGRVAAARILGLTQVPTIRLEHLSDEQVRAYVLVDNRLAEKAGWDQEILAIELEHLLSLDADLDISVTGFTVPEINLILEQGKNQKSDPDDVFESDKGIPAVSQLGDLWLLGKHRIMCGNALEEDCFQALMGGRQANVVFVDVRFYPTAGHDITEFFTTTFKFLSRFSVDESVHFICIASRHIQELLAAAKQVYDLLDICVWVKAKDESGPLYRSRHELILVLINGQSTQENIQLDRSRGGRTSVWEYPGLSTSRRKKKECGRGAVHAAAKPVAMVADALLDCSGRGEIVLDPFLGSGTTVIAAERTRRICYGIESNPLDIDAAVRRWQKRTGKSAVQASSERRFDEIAATKEASHGG
jgi:DNA methylase/ParB-like nuclease domain